MSGVNKVILIGNLGRDPEVKTFQNGDKMANLRVATSESWKDRQTGERREKVEWHSVSIFGGLVEIASKWLRKGSKVYVEGKLHTRKWQDQQGQDRYTTEVVLQGFGATLQLLDKMEGRDGGQSGASGGFGAAGAAGASGAAGGGASGRQGSFPDDLDDDVPF